MESYTKTASRIELAAVLNTAPYAAEAGISPTSCRPPVFPGNASGAAKTGGRKVATMLQTIHQKGAVPRASSIYCVWIRRDQVENSPLVAVWIDREMRGFEREFVSEASAELLTEGAFEEPGGAGSFQWQASHTTTGSTVHY